MTKGSPRERILATRSMVIALALGGSGCGERPPSTSVPQPDAAQVSTCGSQVGDVLCDLELEGYFRNETTGLANAAPYEDHRLSQVLAMGTQPYAIVFTTAFW
jgi:hypothetical protein